MMDKGAQMKVRLKETHLGQLLAYAQACENEGWYYGNRNQFEKRHKEIMSFLREAIGEVLNEQS